jgi:hypothetical protein
MAAKLLASAATALALVAACSAAPTEPTELGRDIGRVHVVHQGLEHIITVTPARAAFGDTVTILSTVTNRTPRARSVQWRTCGMDVETALEFPWPGAMCGGYSALGSIGPGGTLQGSHYGVVKSEPGEYILRIRHLLDPESWVEVSLIVE